MIHNQTVTPPFAAIEGTTLRLKTATTNVIPAAQPGRDYEGGPVRIAGISFENAAPAEPQDTKNPAIITVELEGVNAVQRRACCFRP